MGRAVVRNLKKALEAADADVDKILYDFNARYCSFYTKPPANVGEYPAAFSTNSFFLGVIRHVYTNDAGDILALLSGQANEATENLVDLSVEDSVINEGIAPGADDYLNFENEELALYNAKQSDLALKLATTATGALVIVGDASKTAIEPGVGFRARETLPSPTPSIIGTIERTDAKAIYVRTFVLGKFIPSTPETTRVPFMSFLSVYPLTNQANRSIADAILADASKIAGLPAGSFTINSSGTAMPSGETLSLSSNYGLLTRQRVIQGYAPDVSEQMFDNAIASAGRVPTATQVVDDLVFAKTQLFTSSAPPAPIPTEFSPSAGVPGGGATAEEEAQMAVQYASVVATLQRERAQTAELQKAFDSSQANVQKLNRLLAEANATISRLSAGRPAGPSPIGPTGPAPTTPAGPKGPSASTPEAVARMRLKEQQARVYAMVRQKASEEDIAAQKAELRRLFKQLQAIIEANRPA